MKDKLFIGMLVFAVALMSGCGGSSSTSSDSGSGDGTLSEINSLSDIPDEVLDPQEYDHTTSSSLASIAVASSESARVAKEVQEGGFSRAGCETNRMKKNIIRSAIMPQMILCRMEAMESASGGTAAGDGAFNYWSGDAAAGEGEGEGEGRGPGGEAFVPRMAIKKDGDVLTFVMCNNAVKVMEMVISTANDQYEGHVIHIWGDGFQGRMDFVADGTPDSFTTASFTQSFVEDSDFWSGFGSETLDATPDYNSVYGFYNEDGGDMSYSGAVYARFDTSQGTARFRQDSGGYPAMTVQETFDQCEAMEGSGNCGDLEDGWIDGWLAECGLEASVDSHLCFSMCVEGEECCPSLAEGDTCDIEPGEGHTESFAINSSDPLNLLFTVALSSIYSDAVVAATLPDSSEQPVIEFTSASASVDCSGSDSWTAIPISGGPPDMSACDAMEQEMNNWDTGNLCEVMDNSAAGGGR